MTMAGLLDLAFVALIVAGAGVFLWRRLRRGEACEKCEVGKVKVRVGRVRKEVGHLRLVKTRRPEG
jgi:hypothetical protein